MPIPDLIFGCGAHLHFTLPVHSHHPQHLLPCLAAVATGIHRQHSAQRAGNAGKEFRTAQIVQRCKTRQLCPRHTGFGIHAAVYLETQLAQRAVQQQNHAAQTPVSHQQIAAQAHHIQRLIHRHAAQKDQQVIQIGRLVHVFRHTARPPAGVLAHINLIAQSAAQFRGLRTKD